MSVPTLRWYQLDAIEQTAQAMRNGARTVCINLATGAGKSKLASGLIERAVNKGSSVLFLAHRRKLVDQFAKNLDDFAIDHGVLMRGHPRERNAQVQVASKDTLLSRAVRNDYMGLPDAKLVVVDEMRNAVNGESYLAILDEYRRRGAYIVGLDATPALPDGRGLGPWVQALIQPATISQLIAEKSLLPAKCFAPDRKPGRGGKMRRGIAGDLVESWKKYANNLPTVAFFSKVVHSQEAAEAYNAAGIPAIHIDANTPDDDREEIFDKIENGTYKVVCNVGICTEGTDLPCLGCAQFYMDINSRTGFLQRAGRVLRPHPGQESGVVIDHSGAVFRLGFPDEDQEWTLEGNIDEKWVEKKKAGQTEKALYCGECQLMYKGQVQCPQCGRMPVKPPRSIFAAPKIDSTNELLVEADREDREAKKGLYARDEQIRHWIRCVAVAKSKGGTMGMAAQMFKTKYKFYPDPDFPCYPPNPYGGDWKKKVTEVFHNFGRTKSRS